VEIPFDNSYAQLPERFFAKQAPVQVPEPELIRVNDALAAELGIDPAWLKSADGLAVLSGNALPEGADPIAQAYAGHQFGGFSPQLGDGRALLLGEVVDLHGKRRDIQLKGSGRTPFSRGGDGKSALGPVLREYIVSEAMHAFGVPTTRALAAVATGEKVFRQEGAIPGGIFTRVAASHIRVGTFQYFHAREDVEAVRILADHVIGRHYPEAEGTDAPFLTLLKSVIAAQAELVAHWMSLGFIHGVMNTDNSAISGETIDYGPCAFMDDFHPQCVFSAIDTGGRYAWGNQPDIALWNLTRFAETLLPLLADEPEGAIEIAEKALSAYPETFGNAYINRFRTKLALPPTAAAGLVKDCLDLLAAQEVDFTLFFRHLTYASADGDNSALRGLFAEKEPFEKWHSAWKEVADPVGLKDQMRSANPILIPRNHQIEHAIQKGMDGDYSPFHRMVEALQYPFEDREEFADLEAAPEPHEVVQQTFCGT